MDDTDIESPIFSLEVTQDFPDRFYPSRGLFVKQTIDTVARQPGVSVEVVSPRAYVLPFTWFPHHQFAKLPRMVNEGQYTVHYPRYLYPVPKRILYRYAGASYGHFVKRYMRSAMFGDVSGKHNEGTGSDAGSEIGGTDRKRARPDIMHVHFPYPDAAGMYELATEWNIPLICHVRGGFEVATGKPYRSVEPKLLRALHAADHIIAVSEDTRREYVEKGIPEEKITVVPNGVDRERFRPIPMEEARERCGLPPPEEKQVILFVGYLTHRKGIDRLIEALPDIFAAQRHAMLVVIGEGYLERKLHKRVSELDMTDRVLFRTIVPHDEMPYWENAADVVVLPTLAEGRPNIVIEAMACGRPVVSTAVSGIPELIESGSSGILVAPDDRTALTEAVSDVLADPTFAAHLGTNALMRIEELGLTWDNCGKRTVSIYRAAIAQP